ncbi:hypothetical protein [Parasphingopyxis marina]|uniref:Uncharacterized protein n=1 Tax=Parasphingopyxis marina TaxID=2761622 RepID=A0A842HY76_9SPHN|nr:hypothetical protein [Parasphingopyxis marina]MBC2777301.1 hypothetical protein [Parasphingopyxis marina]
MPDKKETPANTPVELIESELDDIQGAGDPGPAGGGTLKAIGSGPSMGKVRFQSFSSSVKAEGKGVTTTTAMTAANSGSGGTAPSPTEETPTEEK